MKRLKKVGTVAATALLALVLVAVVAIVVIPQARGGASLIIETGSMRPTIQPGDVVVVRPVPPEALNIGDIVTYATQDNLITHRIIAFEGGGTERLIITQGDANNSEDPPIHPAQVRGVVDYTIPRVGLVLPWLGEHVWWIIGVAGGIWLVSWFIETYLKMRKEKSLLVQKTDTCGCQVGKVHKATCSKSPEYAAALDTLGLGASGNGGHGLSLVPLGANAGSIDLTNIGHNLPAFLGTPSATLVRTRTAITAFSEPIEISAEKGEGAHLKPVTVIRTPSLTTAYNEPITVTAAADGNVNLMHAAQVAQRPVRITDIRMSKQEVTVEDLEPNNPIPVLDQFDALNEIDAVSVPVEIAA